MAKVAPGGKETIIILGEHLEDPTKFGEPATELIGVVHVSPEEIETVAEALFRLNVGIVLATVKAEKAARATAADFNQWDSSQEPYTPDGRIIYQ